MEQNPKDPFFIMKHIAYCWALLPPSNQELELVDYVSHCKFVLCEKTSRLMKDPIWEKYTDEEIITEYYAHMYSGDENARKEFMTELSRIMGGLQEGEAFDFNDWANDMTEQNREELADKFEDNVSFSPDSLGE